MNIVTECYKNSDLRLLDKLTVIIPTYNRTFYLSRCLSYLSQFPINTIIVADSSFKTKKEINRKIISAIPNCTIDHQEYDPDTNWLGEEIYRKWADALFRVKTEYSVFCTDKEFLIPTTLCKSIELLEKNKDCHVVDGMYLTTEYDTTNSIKFIPSYSTKIPLNYREPFPRLMVALTQVNASTNIFALRRAEFHKEIYQQILDYSLNDLRFGEITVEFLTLIKSRCIYLPDDYYNIRDHSNLVKKGRIDKQESSNERYPHLDEYIIAGIFNDIFDRFKACLADSLILNSCTLNKDEIQEVIALSVPMILHARGFYGGKLDYPGILDPDSLFFSIWEKIQPKLRKFFGTENQDPKMKKCLQNPSYELNIIKMIIENTADKYINDQPVTDEIFAMR